jgi:hypothetical protein
VQSQIEINFFFVQISMTYQDSGFYRLQEIYAEYEGIATMHELCVKTFIKLLDHILPQVLINEIWSYLCFVQSITKESYKKNLCIKQTENKQVVAFDTLFSDGVVIHRPLHYWSTRLNLCEHQSLMCSENSLDFIEDCQIYSYQLVNRPFVDLTLIQRTKNIFYLKVGHSFYKLQLVLECCLCEPRNFSLRHRLPLKH